MQRNEMNAEVGGGKIGDALRKGKIGDALRKWLATFGGKLVTLYGGKIGDALRKWLATFVLR
jgi:hypothetical protein